MKISYKILTKNISYFLIASLLLISVVPIAAQNLDSGNYTLIAPEIGNTAAGTIDSSNYSQLLSPGLIDGMTVTSTNYGIEGGFARLVQANVPLVSCFDASSTDCAGVPGGLGMNGVCGGICYNRAKFEIDAQGNPADTLYAIQVSTTSDFSSNVYYVDPTTHLLKSELDIADFIPKCQWEGTIATGACVAGNTTWVKYNVLGLTPGTTYYLRVSAHTGLAADGKFSQSPWSPAVSTTTGDPFLNFDIDIGDDLGDITSAPHILDIGNLIPTVVKTSTNSFLVRVESNSVYGITTSIKSLNSALLHTNTVSTIAAYAGDLAGTPSGYGIRNVSSLNDATNTTWIGDITVATTPIDFTDSGATDKVGGAFSMYIPLFTSNGLPIYDGTAGFTAKAKAATTTPSGIYSETLTLLISAIY